jgi:hypothetical protein
MIYSVWNQGRGVYDYYQTSEIQGTANAPRPDHLRSTQLGMPPAQAAWPLPAGSKFIGSGEFARGRVASLASSRSALSGFWIDDLFTLKGIAVVALAWFLWKRARR